jgi:translation initiation factor 6 (eIF-6)
LPHFGHPRPQKSAAHNKRVQQKVNELIEVEVKVVVRRLNACGDCLFTHADVTLLYKSVASTSAAYIKEFVKSDFLSWPNTLVRKT